MPPTTDRTSLVLLGSGEFEPWTAELDRWALARSRRPDGVVLIVPAASAHEGDHVFERWARMGLAHYRGLDLPAEVLDLRTPEDAHREELVARLSTASMLTFSGGNPARLARILEGSPLWTAICAAVADGLPYAGCSAGVSALCSIAFDNEARMPGRMWKPGLDALREVLVAPHWDAIDRWIPGATRAILRKVPDGHAFLGLDERTAVVGDGQRWEVVGRGAAHVRRAGAEMERFAAGASFDLPIGPLR
jgi:cyanophycinase